VSVRDGLEKEAHEVRGPDAPHELIRPDEPADSAQRPQPPDEQRSRGEARADLRQRVDGNWEPRKFEAPRAELGRFNLERAGLPSLSLDSAARYVEQQRASRPWLAVADSASPEARRILAALDSVGGHAHIRHEGWVTEEANMRRVAYREDPAQLDPEKRRLGIDGLRQHDQRHRSGDAATRITDPDAFATAFARGLLHAKVREALQMPFDATSRPDEVTIPIAELLGPSGHKYCTGWQLEPVDASMDTARRNRSAWVAAKAVGRDPDVPEPQVAPVPTLKDGEIVFAFTRNMDEQRYEIVTMFPRPSQPETTDDQSRTH
jgi:hypothetical protein